MATRRVRKSRRSRKSKRGGILGLSFLKTAQDNVNNCKQYWSDGKNPNRCERYATQYDYPGLANKNKGAEVRNKNPDGTLGQPMSATGNTDY